MTRRSCPWLIAELVPHRSPLLLLDEVVEYDDQSLTSAVNVRNLRRLFSGEVLPAYFGIEFMAQTCGAFAGAHARDKGVPVAVGFLLGTRHYDVSKISFSADEYLTITATVVFRDEAMGVFDCRIDSGGERIATARLNVYQPKNLTKSTTGMQAKDG